MKELPIDITQIESIDPQAAIILKSLDKVDGIVNSYKEYKIAQSIEVTKRTAYREQAKIAIRQLEEDTRKYISRSQDQKEIAFKYIDTLNNVLQSRDLLDESTYKICQSLIEKSMEIMR